MRKPSEGNRLLPWIIAALITAVVFHALSRRGHAQGVGFIPSGAWITTERGEKVCQTAHTIARGQPFPGLGFCTNWQEPHRPMMRGDRWPTRDGWVRFWPMIQFHTEQGWKP